MRFVLCVALLGLSACASDRLALTPAPGVDFTGKWRLNESESDDPQRLLQSQDSAPASNVPGAGGQQRGPGGQGRGGRQGGSAAGGFGRGPLGPSMPSTAVLGEGLRWPGKSLDVKQAGGAVTIVSGGEKQIYRPSAEHKRPHRPPPEDAGGRDMPADRGEGPPPHSGWDDKTLVVQTHDPDDGSRFDQRYSVSGDGQRLIEVVSFQGGRSSGYTVSRVWDRVVPGASQSSAATGPAAQGQQQPPQ